MATSKHPVLDYLQGLQQARGTGKATAEQSFKSKLETLLTVVGERGDPKTFATMELKHEGAGHPDLGVFDRSSGNARLVVEVKPTTHDVFDTARGDQVSKYWRHYQYVLVTNLREFVLVVRNEETGEAQLERRYRVSGSSETFWAGKPVTLADEHEQGLADFLAGVLARPAPILRPSDLASDLARHAREAKRRLARHSMDELRPLQEAFEESLGLRFEDEKGERFFRSSLVQTLFYGLFSGWMLLRRAQSKKASSTRFDWKDASDYLALPLLRDLFEEIAKPRRLGELGLREPMEWATTSLNRVEHGQFFRAFDEDHAITLFYEPFLKEFDPGLRKELGVWFTPPEIVRYIVARADHLLKTQLGISDGLADRRVVVLDPATGTGSFVLEVARSIHATLVANGHGAVAAATGVKQALCERVFGFEILTAPYVVAHLQLEILLRSLGAKLSKEERVGIFLTNALTGWEPPKGVKKTLAFSFLQQEQDAAARVKREQPILVVLGNPPYYRFAGVAEDEEADLIEPYKAGLYDIWNVQKQLLDDLYVRFFRLGEKRIGEIHKRGIVCYISNSSWLTGISHPVMRERILGRFDTVYIDNFNGDKYATGKRTPDGRPDESMFTTDDHRVGIQVGTAIATLVARGDPAKDKEKEHAAEVYYRDFWGTGNEKRAALLESVNPAGESPVKYARLRPSAPFRWVIAEGAACEQATRYADWIRLVDLMPIHFSGLNENRQGALMSDDSVALERRMRAYFDPQVKHEDVAELAPGLLRDAARFNGTATRALHHKSRTVFDKKYLIRLAFRPFDETWLYWVKESKLLNEKREEFVEQCWPGNLFISASQKGRKGGFNQPFLVDKLGDLHLQDPWSQYFPLFVREEGMFAASQPNIAPKVLEAVCGEHGVVARTKDGASLTQEACQVAEDLFFHTLAVLWSEAYKRENAAALRHDWARIPIPRDKTVLKASAKLGRELSEILLLDRPLTGVTVGKLRPDLKNLAIPEHASGGSIDPDLDLNVTASWGFRNKSGAIMCGQGRITPNADAPDKAVDVWLNERVYVRNIPLEVWKMTIGGYPVLKKWLSYREHRVLGRAVKWSELEHVATIVRRIRALLLLVPDLDGNYECCAKE
jgi:hypothetical protein